MGQFYKILKADPLGEPWTPKMAGAKPIQNFWCQVAEEELPVSIGKQVPNILTPGQNVYGDLMKATSAKGNDYWKFKSAKVPDDVQRPADTAAPAVDSGSSPAWFKPYADKIDAMHKMVVGEEEPAQEAEKTSGEPLADEDKAVLDGIFGADPEPEEA